MCKLVDKFKMKALESFEKNIEKPIVENCEQGKNKTKYLTYLNFYKIILFCQLETSNIKMFVKLKL